MRGTQSVGFTGISATTAAFELNGGVYTVAAQATWGGGSATLQILLPDGATWAPVTNSALLADGTSGPLYCPPGQYRIAVVTATALNLSVTRVPFD